MNPRRPLDAAATGLMLLLCLTWAGQQIVLKALAADLPPVLHIALRSGLGALLVGALMAARRERLTTASGVWQPGLLAGTLFALEYLLVGEGLRHTSAAHMVVFLYTAPIFAALGLQWKLPSERLSPLQWLGIALAFAGVALAFLGRDPGSAASLASMLHGDLLGLLAGLCWGATTVLIRTTRLSDLPATQTLLYQLVVAFALLLPFAALTGQAFLNPTAAVWLGLAFQAVVVSFGSFLLWFWLLRRYLASRLGVFSFLTPVLGVVLGALLLDEPLDSGFIAGAALTLAGVVLVSVGRQPPARRG